jgi:hypothetical protein
MKDVLSLAGELFEIGASIEFQRWLQALRVKQSDARRHPRVVPRDVRLLRRSHP